MLDDLWHVVRPGTPVTWRNRLEALRWYCRPHHQPQRDERQGVPFHHHHLKPVGERLDGRRRNHDGFGRRHLRRVVPREQRRRKKQQKESESGYETRGTWDTGFGTRGSGLGIRDTGFGTRDSGHRIRDTGFGTRDSG